MGEIVGSWGKLLSEKKMEPCIVVGMVVFGSEGMKIIFPKALNYLPDEQLPGRY